MIAAAAIKFYLSCDKEHRFPQIWTGPNHKVIGDKIIEYNIEYDPTTPEPGFITDKMQYLNDREALDHALAYKQVSLIVEEVGGPFDFLCSEDIAEYAKVIDN